ncbi:hypothetical protein [Amycolatopsis sp. NPDC001370]
MANPSAADSDTDPLQEARSWARHGYEIGQRSCTWSDHGVAPEWLTGWHSFETLSSAADENGDETTSTVPMPAEDGNASERPNQLGETAPLASHDYWVERAEVAEQRAASWWEAAKKLSRAERRARWDWIVLTGKAAKWKARADVAEGNAKFWETRATNAAARADSAEANLAETNRLLTAYQHDVVAWKRERDEALAKLADIRDWATAKEASTREWDKNHNTECECEVAQTTYEVLAELRKIVNPEAVQ